MSMDDYTTCLRGEYNLDEEAVKFIIQIYELGGEVALKYLKDNWGKIAGAASVITFIYKYGGEAATRKFLLRVAEDLEKLGGLALEQIVLAMALGLALAAAQLAFAAAVECLPRLAQ
jgi:hypothetical protein